MAEGQELTWPERPTIHDGSPYTEIKGHEPRWHVRENRDPYYSSYRACSYCGSIHPGDLLSWLEKGATLHGADWKGGPHKFYVEGIPNEKAGETVQVGSHSWSELVDGEYVQHQEPIMGKAPATVPAKFYNEHLLELDDASFARLTEVIFHLTRIRFVRDEHGLKYAAPYRGYQA